MASRSGLFPGAMFPGSRLHPPSHFPSCLSRSAQNTLSRGNLYKDTPEHKAWCEQYVDSNNMLLGEVPYTPTALDRYTVTLPGTQGGVNYYGGAFDPRLGLFVVNVNNLAQPMRIIRNPDGSYSNSGPLAGLVRFWNPGNHLPCTPTPWGQLVAVDVNTGKIAWRTTLGVTDSLPAGKQNTGRPGLGGAIVTASGLTFIGATDDARFRAFDTRTGNLLWAVKLPAAAESTPITYADAKGQQYIAVVATGGLGIGAALASDSLVVFSLTGASTDTLIEPLEKTQSPEPAGVSAPSTPAVGGSVLPPGPGHDLTVRVCSGCHSPEVAASQHLSPQEWNSLVQTMSARGAIATDEELNQITAYLARSFPNIAPPPR
jgi:outer membrane protein assembly factor BamB